MFNAHGSKNKSDLYKLLGFWTQAKGIKVTCLLCYCSEGDNTPEAFSLAEATSKLLGLSIDNSHGEFFLFTSTY